MIIENTGLIGVKSDLAHLDRVTEKLGFIRWQWEYYRATYDLKLIDASTKVEYFLRVNTRVESGKLEKPYSILYIEDVYIGKVTFPHGLDYDCKFPETILQMANQKIASLKQMLAE